MSARISMWRMTRRTALLALAGAVGAIATACGGSSAPPGPATAPATPVPTVPAVPTATRAAAAMPTVAPSPPATAVASPVATPAATPTARRLTVVATTMHLQDFVKNVGGDHVTVLGLLKPGADAHDYEPTVQDAATIAKAEVIVIHGAEYDAWIEKTIQNANPKAPVITATDGLRLLESDEAEFSKGDPHCWFDPTVVQAMVTTIAVGLANADPANAAAYRANATAYQARLEQLDTQVKAIFNQIPREQRKLVTNHDAFQYLAKRYDLTIVGAVIPSLSDAAEPTAKDINDLIETIKRERVKAVFAESQANPRVAEQVAQEAGVKIVSTLYVESLSEPGGEADTYLKMMLYNATTIASALQ